MLRILPFLLFSAAAAHAASPELLCDPDAKVTFQSRWLGNSTVRLSGSENWELPWTGKEPFSSGRELRDAAPDELAAVEDGSSFLLFRRQASSPLETTLFIQRDLVQGTGDDGLVITRVAMAPVDPSAPVFHYSIYHCRSR